MNRKFKHLEHSLLLDQLAQQTALYTRLLNENGSSEDKAKCRQIIHQLMAEINIRAIENEPKDPVKRSTRQP